MRLSNAVSGIISKGRFAVILSLGLGALLCGCAGVLEKTHEGEQTPASGMHWRLVRKLLMPTYYGSNWERLQTVTLPCQTSGDVYVEVQDSRRLAASIEEDYPIEIDQGNSRRVCSLIRDRLQSSSLVRWEFADDGSFFDRPQDSIGYVIVGYCNCVFGISAHGQSNDLECTSIVVELCTGQGTPLRTVQLDRFHDSRFLSVSGGDLIELIVESIEREVGIISKQD